MTAPDDEWSRRLRYWLSRTPEERVAEVERLRAERYRREHNLGPSDPLPRMERVMRVLTWEEWSSRDRQPIAEGDDE